MRLLLISGIFAAAVAAMVVVLATRRQNTPRGFDVLPPAEKQDGK